MHRGKCFVLMRFTEERGLDAFYHDSLLPHITGMGFSCERCDEQELNRLIDRRIIESIYEADLIIADLTTNSPNVFYELGIAHAISQKTILISQVSDLPFNIKGCDVISYDAQRMLNGSTDTGSQEAEAFRRSLEKAIAALKIENPVSEWKPRHHDSAQEFAVHYLKEQYDNAVTRVVLVDLDGTLFNSTKHRIEASVEAFRRIIRDKSDGNLREMYDCIYKQHARFESIIGYNVRYNWRTKEIYGLAHMEDTQKRFPRTPTEFYKWYSSRPPGDLQMYDRALKDFEAYSFQPAPDARPFLKGMQDLGFHLYLFTEGDTEVQEWKLAKLGLAPFFPKARQDIGWAFPSIAELQQEFLIAQSSCEHTGFCGFFCRRVVQLVKATTAEERLITTEKFLHKALKEHRHGMRIAVVGDRYDIDLLPFKPICGSVIRVAVGNLTTEGYREETKEAIREEQQGPSGGTTNFLGALDGLWEAFEFIADPDKWNALTPIVEPPLLGCSIPYDAIDEINTKVPDVRDTACRFLDFQREMHKWRLSGSR